MDQECHLLLRQSMYRRLILERQRCSVQGLISYFAAFVLVINQTDALLECCLRYISVNLLMNSWKHSISTAGKTLSQVLSSAQTKVLAVSTEEAGTISMRVFLVYGHTSQAGEWLRYPKLGMWREWIDASTQACNKYSRGSYSWAWNIVRKWQWPHSWLQGTEGVDLTMVTHTYSCLCLVVLCFCLNGKETYAAWYEVYWSC